MKHSRALLFLLVGLLGAAAGAWTALSQDRPTGKAGASAHESLLGQPRPPWTLGATDGQRLSAGDFDGQVVLVNFWATWCAPCRAEMPMLVEIHEAFGSQGFEVVGIALDDVQQARTFAEELGIDYPLLVGGADVMAVSAAYGNQSGLLPYSVLIDRAGLVRWTHLGELKREELEAQLKPLL